MLYKYIYYKFVFIHWLFEWLVFVKSSQREKYTHTHIDAHTHSHTNSRISNRFVFFTYRPIETPTKNS